MDNSRKRNPSAANASAQGAWSVAMSGIHNRPAPIPISFAIPEAYAATAPGGPLLLDPFTVQYPMNPPLVIPLGCLCELIQASFAYSQPNIATPSLLQSIPNGNNRLSIEYGSPGTWQDIVLPTGLYDFTDVQTQLNIYMRTHDSTGGSGTPMVTGVTDFFILTGISSTQKLIISMNPAALAGGAFPAGGFSVSFANPSPSGSGAHTTDSVGEVLGYPTTGGGSAFTAPGGATVIYSSYAPNVADFGSTAAYALYISFVANSYLNGATGQLLYTFPLGQSAPNEIISFQPTLRFPVPINANSYSTISIWTADQSGKRLPWALYQAPFQFSALISRGHEDGSL